MTLRPVTDADHAAVMAFLRQHEESSIFPLSGLASGAAQQMWVHDPDRTIQGVLAHSSNRILLPQWPGIDASAAVAALRGEGLRGIVGPGDQVDSLVNALAIAPEHLRHRDAEPLCRLDLADLILPDPRGTRLEPMRPADRETVIGWRMAYDVETLDYPAEGLREKAESDADRWLVSGSQLILWQGDVPVAMTGLNGRLPDVVQVGGVYTPPDLRSRGYARIAVAGHLARARAAGASRAVLFAASKPALRAYRAIGFRQVGWMGLVLLNNFQVPA